MLSINFAPFKAISSAIQSVKARQKCIKTEYRQIKEHEERYSLTNILRHCSGTISISRQLKAQVKRNTLTNKMHKQERCSFRRCSKAPKISEGIQKVIKAECKSIFKRKLICQRIFRNFVSLPS